MRTNLKLIPNASQIIASFGMPAKSVMSAVGAVCAVADVWASIVSRSALEAAEDVTIAVIVSVKDVGVRIIACGGKWNRSPVPHRIGGGQETGGGRRKREDGPGNGERLGRRRARA